VSALKPATHGGQAYEHLPRLLAALGAVVAQLDPF